LDVAVLDETGTPVTGEIGELAVLNTWPGMTHAFCGDRQRYLETYWDRWDGVWRHGDLASVDSNGTWRIHGRSDGKARELWNAAISAWFPDGPDSPGSCS
jgi:acetyl-CoA synthetase